MNQQNAKKYPIDILIEELEKIFGKHGIKEGSPKTGSFVYIPAKRNQCKM